MEYQAEQLLPVWQYLAAKYTSNESTSVSYGTAQQLMEAICYCLKEREEAMEQEAEAGWQSSVMAQGKAQDDGRDALMEAWREGLFWVTEKAKKAKQLYEDILSDFEDFGNRALRETMQEGIPVFFRHYDPMFSPQEHLLTLDYPALVFDYGTKGIDRIYAWLLAMKQEQDFLKAWPSEYIYAILARELPDYREQFENLCRPILRHALLCMLSDIPISAVALDEEAWMKVQEQIKGRTGQQIISQLSFLCDVLLDRTELGSEETLAYFKRDFADFAVWLQNFVL